MPVKERRLPGGKVQVSTPNGVKSKGTTKKKADAQRNLLNAIEHDPGFKPRAKR
jgi:hypothetical protein